MEKTLLEHYHQMKVIHLNATREDLQGNNGLGRYVLLTGCRSRSAHIAERFLNATVKTHPRGHDVHTGSIQTDSGRMIDVAAVSTGMGTPSTDIIINELFALGARRFLRVGTAGSLQPETIRAGDVVIATAAVMDNDAAYGYVPQGFPAIASGDVVHAIEQAVTSISSTTPTHTGIVHSKSSLYSRELLEHYFPENTAYMEQLQRAGVLATEMECSQIFVLSSLLSHLLGNDSRDPLTQVKGGAILSIIGDKVPFSSGQEAIADTVTSTIDIAMKSIELMATQEVFT